MADWQPIETAPKDGTRLLMWVEPTKIALPCSWNGQRWMCAVPLPLGEIAWMTHWMHMPAPPKED